MSGIVDYCNKLDKCETTKDLRGDMEGKHEQTHKKIEEIRQTDLNEKQEMKNEHLALQKHT